MTAFDTGVDLYTDPDFQEKMAQETPYDGLRCDECGELMVHRCADSDGNGYCDVCKYQILCMHSDVVEGVSTNADGYCDECGRCMSGCTKDSNKDGLCDDCWVKLPKKER